MTIRDGSDHEMEGAWPEFLPDNRHFLLYGRTVDGEQPGDPALYVVALETGRASVLLGLTSERGSRAVYAAPGYLVYTRDGALVGQMFDQDKRVVSGEPVTLVEHVEGFGPAGLDNFSVAGDVLAYQSESTSAELLWKDRNGRTVGRVGSPGAYADVTLAPDGRKLAAAMSIPFMRTPFSELNASFSPDGTWVAYASDESGLPEVHVTTFPEPGEKHRISTGGGYLPEWRGDGNELFYLALDNRLMAVPVGRDAGFEPKTPTPLFTIESYENAVHPYDVLPDGERFIVISALPGEATTPIVVTGWQESVQR